jgi:hypothetical protein
MIEDLVSTAVVLHKRLNPRLWTKGQLKPLVRFRLLKIAKNFIDFIGIDDIQLKDVTVSGSNAAYTYSRHSDIDLHLIVDIPEDQKNLYKNLYDAKKNQYNFVYDIKIKNIDVELYVQDSSEPHTSSGVYSVLDDRWVKVPEKVEATLDRSGIKKKYKHLKSKINTALRSTNVDAVKKVSDDIKKLRKEGLEKQGELGVENIAFKLLRAKGYLERLRNHISNLKAQELSLETQNEN